MAAMTKIENQLADVFKNAPKLSDGSRESLASIFTWIALISGLLQIFAAWSLYGLTRYIVSPYLDYANSLSVATTGRALGPTGFDKTMIYIGIVFLLVEGLILLAAFPKLRARSKSGWDLLFLATLVNVIYSVLSLFTYGRGVASFLFNLIGSALAFYLLFQVRPKFGGPRVTKPVVTDKK